MQIKNDLVTLEFKTQAAEITSFKLNNSDYEYMWQGNPEFWSGRNPILFPMVGNTYNKQQIINGKTYQMGNHGFARHSDFKIVEQGEDYVVLALSENAETLAQYPFKFTLQVTYRLKEDRVNIEYEITNHSTTAMPFSFGLHPAFNCPINPKKKFTDYYLEFACQEQLTRYTNYQWIKNDESVKKLPLKYEELVPTIMLKGVNSPSVSLTDGTNGVEVGCNGYRYLAFWTKQNAPYVCIEPWHGLGDLQSNDLKFEDREGTMILEPEHSYITSYFIRLF